MFGKKRIKMDADLYRRAREAAAGAGYATAGELIEHAVEKLLGELGQQEREDQQSLEERLRGLGYIS